MLLLPMLEQIKAVNNPLTIIAIFAALAEVAGTVALATVDKSVQGTFVWFVMGFPVLLVVSFFATLNFNPKVLYAPSDFKNEENFLNTVVGTRSVSMSLEQVMEQLEETKERILNEGVKQIFAVGGQQEQRIMDLVKTQLSGIETRLQSVRRQAEVVASAASGVAWPQSALQARILSTLRENEGQMAAEIATRIGMSEKATTRALERLCDRGLITRLDGETAVYCLRAAGTARPVDAG